MLTLFPRLPAELRMQIWREALLAPAVWFITFRRAGAGHPAYVSMTPVGPAPYLAGLACRESRQEMKAVMDSPLITMSQTDRRKFWLSWDHTVLHVGQHWEVRPVWPLLHRTTWARVKHVALEIVHEDSLYDFASGLANLCPHVRTIIVHDRSPSCVIPESSYIGCGRSRVISANLGNPPPWAPLQLTPTAKTAALYADESITNPESPELSELGEEREKVRQIALFLFI
jgi:2EXR family protein